VKSSQKKKKYTTFKISAVYFITALAWIIFSSEALRLNVSIIDDFKNAEIYKGLFFVLITTVILFFIIRYFINEDKKLQSKIEFERLKYEEKLEESEIKYRCIVENSQNLIWSLDPEGKIIFINNSSKNIFGIEPEKMIGRRFSEFMPSSLAETEIDNIKKAALKGNSVLNYESKVLNSENIFRYLQVNGYVIRNAYGDILSISGTSIDITDRVMLEARLENITNVYEALTKINELFLRAKDQETILKESLKITVESGKFKASWIGFVNKDTGDVEIKYFYGINEEYIKNLKINIYEPAGARGPIVRSLVEKTYYISNDIEDDPMLSRWKKETIKYGFNSFATFPIEVGDKVIGTFNIYDDNKNRFSSEAIRLLLQLMEDITYAIERFELENQRKYYENLFHKIVDKSTVAIIMERHGDIMYANPAAMDLFSVKSLDELTFKPVSDFISNESRSQVKSLMENVYRGEKVNEEEVKMMKIDGTNMFTVFSATPYMVEGQTGSLSFIRDVTSEKLALEALRTSEEKWRSLFENTPSFVTTINKELKITSANRAPLPLRTEEILGHSILEYTDFKMKDEICEIYEFVFKTGEPSVYHTTGYGEYGREAYFRVQVIPQLREGEIHQLTLISSDITETKRASDALLESQLRLNSIVDTALDAIITVDSSLKIVLFNKAAEIVFKCFSTDAIGTHINRFIPDISIPTGDHYTYDDDKVTDEAFYNSKGISNKGLRTNGNEFPIEASVSRSKVENKTLYTIILRDISERIRAENELKDSYQKVRDLAAHLQSAREDERINIAREIHDQLGQELSALKMDISFLNRKIEKTKVDPDWNTIQDTLKSMTNIADQTIKSVRKISSQLRPDVLDKLGLKDAIEWLSDDFSKRTGIACCVKVSEFGNELSKNIQTVIYRICQESLTNIMRHANASKVSLNMYKNNENIQLEIDDNGKGITNEEINNGRSLGLVGMKERAYFVGGLFEIEGKKDKGTMVKVIIPYNLTESSAIYD